MKQENGMGIVFCNYCQKEFEKKNSEIKRNISRNKVNYCSLKCSGKANFRNLGKNLGYQGANKPDEFSPFRRYVRDAKGRGKELDIDVKYLKDLWERQSCICIYTGVSLKHPKRKSLKDNISTASLDRIDCNLGYIKGNVQFISVAANYMKFQMSHEEMIEFCKLVTNHWK